MAGEPTARSFGRSVLRLEDHKLLRGAGRFVDDIAVPGALHAAFVRSLRDRFHHLAGGRIRRAARPIVEIVKLADGRVSGLQHLDLKEARDRQLQYLFACTTEQRATSLFEHLGFRRVDPPAVPSAKWRGYDRKRIALLTIFRRDLVG